MTRALLSFGSNLGDRAAHLRGAVGAFADVLVAVSPVYETPPWGDPDQPAYLNAVALVADERAGAGDWLHRAQEAERLAGRVRDPRRHYGPRTLDVDVIAVWAADGSPVVSTDPVLTVPHPRAHLRAFILRPWFDLDATAVLPGHGPVSDLLGTGAVAADLPGLRARPDVSLEITA